MPNVLAAYMQGQQAVENNKRNKLLQMQVDNAPAEQQQRNKLLDLQVAGQQQNLDAGKFELDSARDKQGRDQGIAAAGYIIDSKAPKLEAEQRYPQVVQQMRQQGVDWDSLQDDDVREIASQYRNQLAAKGGVGRQPKLETAYGPDGQVIQTDPLTGKVTQAIAPRENFREKADYNDKLARRREAEQRAFTLDRDANNAELQRELAKQRALSKDEKATDGQRLSAGFLLRMRDTEPDIGDYTPSTKDYVLYNKILKNEGGLFGSGTAAELNKQLSPEAQAYFQRVSDWVRAKLRKESGAVISPQEMLSEITTYFPLPGEGEKAKANKKRSRDVAIEAMEIAAGSVGQRERPGARTPPPGAAELIADGPNGPIVLRNGQWVPLDG